MDQKQPKKRANKKKVSRKKTAKAKPGRKKTIRSKVTVSKAKDLSDNSDVVYSNGTGKPDNGRPPKSAKLSQIKSLAAIGCTHTEIAHICGMSKDIFTLLKKNNPSVVEAIEAGKAEGCGSLRKKQHEVAMGGSADMLKWLGKNRLGQADRALIHQETSEGDTLKMAMEQLDDSDESE